MPNSILIVDDSTDNIDILVDAMSEDYEIRAATSAASALESIERKKPDLILLDIVMPGMDGYEVCKKLKANESTCKIPIIFITSLTDIENEAKGLSLGAVDFITKPFNTSLVKARVKNQIELKSLRDHLEKLVEHRTNELELTQDTVIECIVRIGEFRNTEIDEHIIRTQNYVKILAEDLINVDKYKDLLTPKYLKLLLKCVPLHDIGKVVVPDDILLKPGKLTIDEFKIIKNHTTAGKDILLAAEKKLGKNSFLSLAMEMAEFHHEKWDGSGYPQGLSGENIPLPGRLMAIADVYDALLSKRVYKEKFPHDVAVKIFSELKGVQFDPLLVDIFLHNQNKFKDISGKHVEII